MGFTCVYISEPARVDLAIHLSLPVFVYESVEGHAVFPAGGEVRDVDIGIPATTKKRQGMLLTEHRGHSREEKAMSGICSAPQHMNNLFQWLQACSSSI